ncbi:MAG TPA: threonine synthase [Bryobacteraceae bacterium]|nr:threonine synthase [Bryobacteraceae bacterium]
MSNISHLECSVCGKQHEAGKVQTLCDCGGPLLVRYDLAKAKATWPRDSLAQAPSNMWRYAPLLPVTDPKHIVTLGEGLTPLMKVDRLGARLGVPDLWVKDDGLNPTGSFKARGMACAVSMCVEFGQSKIAVASAGNAGSALAAYGAASGIEAHIFVPRDVPRANYIEYRAYGARVNLIDGLISDCGRIIAERKQAEGWFDISGLKEPYRIEGKKTMGYEIAEQFGWKLPDAILYPTGGGVGLIGMWKAFEELEALGWISSARPKMIAVQTTGCQPVVRAFEQGEARTTYWEDAHTVAAGLRVPKPLGDALTLSAIRASGGTAIAVTDEELLDASLELAAETGIFAAPEGGACLAGLKKLLANSFLAPDEQIVLYNTATGLKYLEAFSTRFPQTSGSEQDKLGGLITPR